MTICSLSKLIKLTPDSRLWPWQPQAKYHLLDMGAISRSKLSRSDSLVALLFRLEQPCSLRELQGLIEEVKGWFRRHKGLSELERLFYGLVHRALRSSGMSVRNNWMTRGNMLVEQIKAWKKQWRAKAKAAGRAEGRAVGKMEGKAEVLVAFLVSRFGALPASVRKRIRSAKLVEIERWLKRVVDARNLASVFHRPRGQR